MKNEGELIKRISGMLRYTASNGSINVNLELVIEQIHRIIEDVRNDFPKILDAGVDGVQWISNEKATIAWFKKMFGEK